MSAARLPTLTFSCPLLSQRVLEQSLLDLELLHKREELEQLELEQALAISLAIEEERLRLLELEAENDFENEAFFERKGDENQMVFIPTILVSASHADQLIFRVTHAPCPHTHVRTQTHTHTFPLGEVWGLSGSVRFFLKRN